MVTKVGRFWEPTGYLKHDVQGQWDTLSLTVRWGVIEKDSLGAEEMAQWLRVLTSLPEEPGFNFQHSHGSSQLSITLKSDTLTQIYLQTKHQCK